MLSGQQNPVTFRPRDLLRFATLRAWFMREEPGGMQFFPVRDPCKWVRRVYVMP